MTTQAQGLRRAKLFDGMNPQDGRPRVDRARLEADEIQRIIAYLKGGSMVLFSRSSQQDLYRPGQPSVVPMTFETDGTWIWSGAVRYYLEQYGLPPEADFVAHIKASGYTIPVVSEEANAAAKAVILGGGTA